MHLRTLAYAIHLTQSTSVPESARICPNSPIIEWVWYSGGAENIGGGWDLVFRTATGWCECCWIEMGILHKEGHSWSCCSSQDSVHCSRLLTDRRCQSLQYLCTRGQIGFFLDDSCHCCVSRSWAASDHHQKCLLEWRTHQQWSHLHVPAP